MDTANLKKNTFVQSEGEYYVVLDTDILLQNKIPGVLFQQVSNLHKICEPQETFLKKMTLVTDSETMKECSSFMQITEKNYPDYLTGREKEEFDIIRNFARERKVPVLVRPNSRIMVVPYMIHTDTYRDPSQKELDDLKNLQLKLSELHASTDCVNLNTQTTYLLYY